MVKALTLKGKPCPEMPLLLKITAQGGVGTAEEHSFLLEHYQLNAVGWGSPFLLVPEATAVDTQTRELLKNAKEMYLKSAKLTVAGRGRGDKQVLAVKNNTILNHGPKK